MFQPLFAAGIVEQDAAHRLGRRGEEVAAALPLRLDSAIVARAADQAKIRLVDERGGVESLSRPFVGQPGSRQAAQLLVNERQQLGSGLGIAMLDGVEKSGGVGHYIGIQERGTTRFCRMGF